MCDKLLQDLQLWWRQFQVNETNPTKVGEAQVADRLHEIDVAKIPSPVLARLIEEVRNEEKLTTNAYNRYHNRHNRSR